MQRQLLNVCDECGSKYYADTSRMANLCPECSHILYGYENCNHEFENGRCKKCYWDGRNTPILESIQSIEVCDSYKFSDGRLVAFLRSSGGKLPDQTILEDGSGSRWEVRQYFWTTGSIETYRKREKEEAENIFQYLIEGINQAEKPAQGVILKIVEAPNTALPK